MNQNTAPRDKRTAGTSQAAQCVKHEREEVKLGEDGKPLLSPEEHRLKKIEEALEVRKELDRLRTETNARIWAERRYKF